MRGYTSLILPEVQEIVATGDAGLARAAVEDLLPPDLADLCSHLGAQQATVFLTLLPVAQATDVLEHLELDAQIDMIERLGRPRLVTMLDEMNPDDRVDLLKRLPEETTAYLMPLLAQAERNDVKRLLAYPEETAGALMTTEYVWLKADLTADEALGKLRQVAPDSETIYYVYVVDPERRLQGVVSLREIICAGPRRRLEDLMTEHPVTVRVDDDQEAVARVFEKYDLQSVPVIEPVGERLVGIITVDDVLDVIEEEATEDVQQLGGLAPLDETYMHSSLAHLVRKRVVWLVVLLLAQNVTALALTQFRNMLDAAVFLLVIPFITLVNSSGGNTGSQSSVLVIRALATGDVAPNQALRVLARELASGVCLGVVVAAVGLGAVLLWGASWSLALVVAAAIGAVIVIGAVLGTVVPFGFYLVGIDPAVASGPLIASISDAVGITTYFLLARLVLQTG